MTRIPHFFAVMTLCVGSTSGFAHPASYVDGWASVQNNGSIHLRLRTFVHDVARQHGLPDERVSADQFRQAIERHSEFLLDSLQIYHRGQPLRGEVESTPKWNPTAENVDLATEGAVRLQWDLMFPSDVPHIESVCITHQLMPPGTSDGELRLHLRTARTQRRVSAVIPPRRAVTILLPQEKATNRQNDPNGAVSNLIVTPTAVIHEFMAPLAVIRCGGPQLDARITAGLDGKSQSFTMSDDVVSDVQTTMKAWMQRHVSLHAIDTLSALTADEIRIEFLPATDTLDFTESASRTSEVPIFGTTIGIRSRYEYKTAANGLQLQFASLPGDIGELLVNIVTPRQQRTFTLQPNTEPTAPALDFVWRPSGKTLSENDTSLSPVAPQLSESPKASALLKPAQGLPRWLLATAMLAGSVLIGAVSIAGRLSTRRRKMAAGIVTVAVVCGLVSFRATPTADAVVLTKHTQWLLDGIYQTTSRLDRRHAAWQLERFLDEDLTEAVYLTAVQSLASSGQETWINVQSVRVNMLHQTRVHTHDHLEVDCSWTVSGNVHHWGHLHQRTLINSGQFHLRKREGDWKISQMTMTDHAAIVTDHNGRNPREI